MNREGCPVCGYKMIQFSDESTTSEYERCICCGTLCGYDYNLNSSLNYIQTLRNNWVLYGFEMWSGSSFDKPNGWSPFAQMKQAGFKYPLIPTLMGFHHLGLIDDKYAQDWADRNIESELDDIDALIIISMHGMPRGMTFHDYNFPMRRKFNYSEEFALWTQKLDISDSKQSQQYISWVARNCIGGDLDLPDVIFGYQLDDFIERGIDPYDYMLSKIDGFKESTLALNNELWEEIK